MHAPLAAERSDRDTIVIHQANVAKRHCQTLRKHHLVWITPIHGGTDINGNDQGEIFFFQEDLQEESIKSSKDVPVDEAEVIAVHIGAEVSKLNTLAAPLGTTLALNLASEDLPAHHVELPNACHQCCVNEIINALGTLATWLPLKEQTHEASSGTCRCKRAMIPLTIRSESSPSASASKLGAMRCRNALAATACTSAIDT